jgi:DNA-binding Lrp family transcriptional regulator
MDDIDRVIVARLMKNARTSNRELAREAGIADSTCSMRIAALQESGIISGFHAEIDLARVGRSVQAHASLKIRPQALPDASAFCDWVAELPEVIAVHMVSGPSDLVAHVAVSSTDELREFVLQLARRSEIADIRTSIIYLSKRSRAFSV